MIYHDHVISNIDHVISNIDHDIIADTNKMFVMINALNDLIVSRSHDARLVFLNRPGPLKYLEYEESCILDNHISYNASLTSSYSMWGRYGIPECVNRKGWIEY